jgi:predicted DNA-binding protein (UPF0251 family)
MARPPKCRRIGFSPTVTYFKPRGIGMALLEEVSLELDEVEALRLADLESLYQAEAAGRMGVSRQTFAIIVARARRKVADAIIHGKALKIALPEESTTPPMSPMPPQPCCKEEP